MSSARTLSILAALTIICSPLEGQSVDTLRARLNRAVALAGGNSAAAEILHGLDLRAAASLSSAKPVPRLRLSDGEAIVVGVLKGNEEDATSIAAAVTRAARDFAGSGLPLDHYALVDSRTVTGGLDTADITLLAGRRLVAFSTTNWGEGAPEKNPKAWRARMAEGAIAALEDVISRDELRRWVGRLTFEWKPETMNESVFRRMIANGSETARHCVNDDASQCALFLGIDGSANSIKLRFPSTDARRTATRLFGMDPHRAKQCIDGDDPACYELVARYGPPSTALEDDRMSLLAYVRQQFGAPAIAAILADSTSAFPKRLHHATRINATNLAGGWRGWLLKTARPEPVHAGLRELVPVVLLVGMLLTLVSRSGRWRA